MSAVLKVKTDAADQAKRQASPSADLLFSREDWSLYCSLATLSQKAGVPREALPWLVAKELVDNALDAADAAENPGAVEISIDPCGNLIVDDYGKGFPMPRRQHRQPVPRVAADAFKQAAAPCQSWRRGQRTPRGGGIYSYREAGQPDPSRPVLMKPVDPRRVPEPRMDGLSHIVSSEPIAPRHGTRLTVSAMGPFSEDDLWAARNAIELAQRSGQPSFDGRPSPHWHDADHFHILTMSAVGDLSVRQFLSQFHGCTGSRVQSEIAAQFLHRPIRSLTASDAAELLRAAQERTRTPTRSEEGAQPLGRDAVAASAYAIETAASRKARIHRSRRSRSSSSAGRTPSNHRKMKRQRSRYS